MTLCSIRRCNRSSDELRAFVDALIGEPWAHDGRHCWRLAREVIAFLGHDLPMLFDAAPAHRRDRAALADKHRAEPWAQAWRAQSEPPQTWAAVLMYRPFNPRREIEHCGVYLPMLDGGGVLHCDRPQGVCFDTLIELRVVRQWQPVFFVPDDEAI